MTREDSAYDDQSDQYSDQNSDGDYETSTTSLHASLYAIVGTLEHEDGTVIDFYLQRLDYNDSVSQAGTKTFRVFGGEIEFHGEAAFGLDHKMESLTQVVGAGELDANITLNPSGSEIRNVLSQRGDFTHGCNNGFLYDYDQLQDIVSRDLPQLSPFRPLCPVCLGEDLLDEHLQLRTIVDSNQLLDITPAIVHVTKRNVALNQIGYIDEEFSNNCFDAREWGFNFDDDHNAESLGAANFVREANGEIWQLPPPESQDAHTVNVVTARPAAKDAIGNLSRKVFGEIGSTADGAQCLVCHEMLEMEAVVAQMPCTHVFHEHCIVGWLAGQNMCPTCRFALPTADEEEGAGQPTANEDDGATDPHDNEHIDETAEAVTQDVMDSQGHQDTGTSAWADGAGGAVADAAW